MQAGILGGLSAAATWGVAHGGSNGTSPFGKSLLLVHGVVRGDSYNLEYVYIVCASFLSKSNNFNDEYPKEITSNFALMNFCQND